MDQRRHYFFFCILLFFSHPSHSEESVSHQEKPSDKRHVEEPQPLSFPETLIKSTFLKEFSQDSGIWPSESLDSENIDFANEDPFNVFNQHPSLFGKSEISRGSPGLSLRGSQSLSRVQGLLDDIPLVQEDGIGMSSLFIPHETLSEVRIIKGPSSLSYGGHAMGGALLFKPSKMHSWRIRTGANSLGQGHLFFGGSMINKERNHLQLTLYGQTFKGSYPFDIPRLGLSGQRRHHTNRDLYRTTLLSQQKIKTWMFKEYVLFAFDKGQLPGPISQTIPQKQNRKASLASVTTEKTHSENSKTTLRLSYLNLDYDNTNMETSNQFDSRSNTLSSSLSHSWIPYSIWIFHNTLDYSYSQYHSSNTPSTLKSTTIEVSTLSQILFSKNWILQPGVRYNNKKFLTSFGVRKYLSDKEFLWASYSEGYRPPSLTDRFYEDSLFVGNPHLKSESSVQLETGFQREPPDALWKTPSYMARFFLIDYKNLISPVSGTPGTVDNISKANVFGADVKLTWSLTTNTKINGGYSYLQTRDHIGKELLFSPEHQASLSLQHSWKKLIFDVQQIYWSPHQLSANHRANEWHSTNFRIRTMELSKWSLRAGVLNIFNRPQELTEGYPEPQRRIYVSAERVL